MDATKPGTADGCDYDPIADEVLASEIATVLHMMQTGKCTPPWLNATKQRSERVQDGWKQCEASPKGTGLAILATTRTASESNLRVRRSDAGAFFPALGQAHFCPWEEGQLAASLDNDLE